MHNIEEIQKAIREQQIDGWLFFNLNHLDPVSDMILGVEAGRINTRKWFYIIRSSSEPIKICHTIEAGILDHLPGERIIYSGFTELNLALNRLKGTTLAAQFSPALPSISFLDHGTAIQLIDNGVLLTTSAPLVHKLLGTLSAQEIVSHKRAAAHLYEIIHILWKRICEENGAPLPLEKELLEVIYEEFHKRGLISKHIPIVASGSNSADPHFDTSLSSKRIKRNEVIQFDIWAREPEGIFADISWIGFTGKKPPEEVLNLFDAVTGARDTATDIISNALQNGSEISGSEIDSAVRNRLTRSGFGELIAHRTGHAIDRDLHGWGVNIDGFEFPDSRSIGNGSCFSIEPGLYAKEFGMRSEINCVIEDGALTVTGPEKQKKLLTIGE